MKPSEVRMVANLAAMQAVSRVTDQITDLVQYETMKVLPAVKPEKLQAVNPSRYQRCYIEPPSKPASNYASVMMRFAEWVRGRGDLLDQVYLQKPATREILQVQQYGNDCAVMRRDDAQPGLKKDDLGKVIDPGKSVWVQFDPLPGQIDQVVARLLAKGWVVKQSNQPKVQLTLVESMAAA